MLILATSLAASSQGKVIFHVWLTVSKGSSKHQVMLRGLACRRGAAVGRVPPVEVQQQAEVVAWH